MVIWLIGMSGSGKTTIAQELIRLLRQSSDREKWVLIDGDIFRNIMGEDVGHSIEERKKNADRICALCSFLDKILSKKGLSYFTITPSGKEQCIVSLCVHSFLPSQTTVL